MDLGLLVIISIISSWLILIAGVLLLICLKLKKFEENKILASHRFWYLAEGFKYFPTLLQLACSIWFDGNKREMAYPLGVSCACFIVWAFVQKKQSTLKEKSTKDLLLEIESLKGSIESFAGLNTTLNQCVKRKIERIAKVEKNKTLPSIEKVRKTLKPSEHLYELLESIGNYFYAENNMDSVAQLNFRVGIYLNIDGDVRPVVGIDLFDPGYSPFVSYEKYPEKFKMENRGDQSNVVKCIQSERTIVVGDCLKESEIGNFSIYHEAQNSYLRSMIAFFLGKCVDEKGNVTTGCLAIDCNAAGFFEQIEKDRLYNLLDSFSLRIKLELMLKHLLNDGEANGR